MQRDFCSSFFRVKLGYVHKIGGQLTPSLARYYRVGDFKMLEILKTLKDTPLPSILVIGGMAFLLLSFVRKIGSNIELEPEKKGSAAFIGFILLFGGIGLYLVPTPLAITPTETPIVEPTKQTIQPTATIIKTPTYASPPDVNPTNTQLSVIDSDPIISIQDIGSYTGSNLGIAPETQNFNGVEFETGWIATTQSKGGADENKPSSYSITVQNNPINSSKVFFLWQASWAVGRSGDEIGNINIHLSNGQVLQEKIVVGVNIRDWSEIGNKLSSPNAQEAHNNGSGIVDMFFVEIPTKYNDYEITQIDIQDTSESMGIHLWAITIK
jgi:hypothetical protein